MIPNFLFRGPLGTCSVFVFRFCGIFILSASSILPSMGQNMKFEEGYLESKKGEMIIGKIYMEESESLPDHLLVKKSHEDESSQRIPLDELVKIVIENRFYVKQNLSIFDPYEGFTQKEVFLRGHILSDISLYSCVDEYGLDHFFIETEPGKLVGLSNYISQTEARKEGTEYVDYLETRAEKIYEVNGQFYYPSPDFVRTLSVELGDCFNKLFQVDKLAYSLESFKSILLGYHNCSRNFFQDMSPTKNPITLNNVIVYGSWRFPRPEPEDWRALRWTSSVLFELSRKNSFPMIFYNGGIEYMKFGDARAISLPQMIKLKTKLKRSGFYLRAGLSLVMYLNDVNRQRTVNIVAVKLPKKPPFYSRVGIGYNQPILKDPDLFLSASWDGILLANTFTSNWNIGLGTYIH